MRRLLLAILLLLPGPARADEALLAVAANLLPAMEKLQQQFEAGTGHRLSLSVGSTGQLYAQIEAGAPYDVFLAADAERPALLVDDRLAVQGSRFTYALGKLVLWSADPALPGPDGVASLRGGQFRHLAIANPQLAPYGAAALQVLERLDLLDALRPRLVMGTNIAHAHGMVASGAAELGLVARAQVNDGQGWPVPDDLYDPIAQDAVLLAHGADNAAARDFLDWLKGGQARAILAGFGYGLTP